MLVGAGKGRKDRMAPLPDRAKGQLAEHLGAAEP